METVARGEALRDAILDAADRLLARFGYDKMTMDDLAQEAGVSKRTIYLHFTSKEEVALSSIDRVVDRLLAELRSIADSTATPIQRVRQMLLTRILFRFDSVQDYYQSFDAMFAAIRPAYMARRERYFEAEAQAFVQVLNEGSRLGVFACEDTHQTAHTLLLATNSLLPYSLSARELGARKEIERKTAAIADLLLDGLRRRDEQSKRRSRPRASATAP